MPEVVLRPGRAPYRARRKPYAQVLVDDHDEDSAVIVWRTHDVDLATALAGRAWTHYVDGRDPLPGPGLTGWFRLVPWGRYGRSGERSVQQCRDGEPGATPAVMFEPG
jgi:hypothetical protein